MVRSFALAILGRAGRAALILGAALPQVAWAASTCHGSVSRGSIENAVALPVQGDNFQAYTKLGATLGRTYVHSQVRDIAIEAYRASAAALPGKTYVYGETGWATGGRIRPHRTHQNGTSVDFFVPVIDASGRSVPLPSGPGNKFGYDIEFDKNGRYEGYTIDFEAIGEHLYQLDIAARRAGSGLALVILDPPYLPRLFATRHGAQLRRLNFMQGQAWVRHDEHYHVDFALPCKPL